MCGIVGFTGAANSLLLRKMCQLLTHRGPDDEGYFEDGQISLGARRLAVVDPVTGRQPATNENGNIWVAVNGEIYNHVDLRRELEAQGHRFRSHHSDTEVVVHLYEEYGERWAVRANGMFGAAIWDAGRQRLLLCRDRIGEKPLYYVHRAGQVIFASEIKALLAHPRVSRAPDWRSLYHYFGLKNTIAPQTAYEEVRQLLPGQYLVWDRGIARTARYWQLDFSEELDVTEQEAAEHLLKLLDDAVDLRMKCDAHYGAYLSGGVDSSTIVSLMSRHQRNPVVTFNLAYEDVIDGKQADRQFAMEIARRLGTEHHEYRMRAAEIPETLPQVLRAFDEPFSGVISTWYLSTLIHRFVKVALSGDGADELFGSYLAHRIAQPMQHYLRLVGAGREDETAWSDEDRRELGEFAEGEKLALLRRVADDNPARWRSKLQVFDGQERLRLLTPEFIDRVEQANPDEPYESLAGQTTAHDPLNVSLEMDQKDLLPNQVLPFVDRLSMAHSIEVRVPFLDYRIIEFASKLPAGLKINPLADKYILKRTVGNLLPPELIQRPKEGFVLPVYQWMRGPLRPYVQETLHPDRVARHGLLRPEAVSEVVDAHYDGGQDRSAQVWNLVCFQVWWETCMAA